MNRREFVKMMLYFLFGWLTRQETGHRWETANPLEDLRAYDREVRPLIGTHSPVPVLDQWLIESPSVASTQDQSSKFVGDISNPDSDMQVYHWISATGVINNVTASSILKASTLAVFDVALDDTTIAIYSKSGHDDLFELVYHEWNNENA